MAGIKTREAVAVFVSERDLDKAIAELESTAFPRQDISVLGSTGKLEKKLGQQTVDSRALEDNEAAPRTISIRPEEKTIGAAVIIGGFAYAAGTIAALQADSDSVTNLVTALTVGSLAGGIVGAIIVWVIARRMNRSINKRINQGGLLLWVRTEEKEKEKVAQEILRKHGGRDIHIHSIS